ncbi:MAG: histidine phosphatase family protein [Phycisphaerales bacterium]
MLVVLARHGKAIESAASGRDRDRTLRPRGHRQAEFLGSALAAMDTRPQRVIASPYPRAWETAAYIAKALALDPIADERLEVGCSAGELIEVIATAAETDLPAACFVGHNPTLEDALGVLIDGPAGPPVRVRTGEAFCVEIDPADPMGRSRVVAQIRLED